MLLQSSHSSKSNATNRILKLREQFLKSAKQNNEEITNIIVRSVKSVLRVEVMKPNKKTRGESEDCPFSINLSFADLWGYVSCTVCDVNKRQQLLRCKKFLTHNWCSRKKLIIP